MELPAEVLVHNELIGMKGAKATLLAIGGEGYYEVNCAFGDRQHRVLLPVSETVIISREAEASYSAEVEIER